MGEYCSELGPMKLMNARESEGAVKGLKTFPRVYLRSRRFMFCSFTLSFLMHGP